MLFINLLDAILAGLIVLSGLYVMTLLHAGIFLTAAIAGVGVFLYRTVAPFVLTSVIELFNRESKVA